MNTLLTGMPWTPSEDTETQNWVTEEAMLEWRKKHE